MYEYRVYLNNEYLDTVFYIFPFSSDHVKGMLVYHDNYSPGIVVKFVNRHIGAQ